MTCVYMYISLEYLSILGCFSMDDDDDGCGWLCYKKQRWAVDSYYGNGNTKECVWCVSLNLFGTLRHLPNNIEHTHQPRDAGTRKKKNGSFLYCPVFLDRATNDDKKRKRNKPRLSIQVHG